jgi:hypothetical protein
MTFRDLSRSPIRTEPDQCISLDNRVLCLLLGEQVRLVDDFDGVLLWQARRGRRAAVER